jgi:hypothetical protein
MSTRNKSLYTVERKRERAGIRDVVGQSKAMKRSKEMVWNT